MVSTSGEYFQRKDWSYYKYSLKLRQPPDPVLPLALPTDDADGPLAHGGDPREVHQRLQGQELHRLPAKVT